MSAGVLGWYTVTLLPSLAVSAIDTTLTATDAQFSDGASRISNGV
jgi:hypothetical protein